MSHPEDRRREAILDSLPISYLNSQMPSRYIPPPSLTTEYPRWPRRPVYTRESSLGDGSMINEAEDDDLFNGPPPDPKADGTQELVKLNPEEVGMTANYKNLYSGKEDRHGRFQWQPTIPEDVGKPAEDADTERYAIVVRNMKTYNDPQKVLTVHSILIQSPLLKEVLAKVLVDYPDVTVGLKRLQFTGKCEPLVHRWDALQAAIQKLRDDLSQGEPDPKEVDRLKHAELLSNLILREFGETIESSQDMKSKGVINYDLLWTLLQPGQEMYCKQQGHDRVMKLKSSVYVQDAEGKRFCRMRCSYVEWGGSYFGTNSITVQIGHFEGTRPIMSLAMVPLVFHHEKEQVKAKLIERGAKVESLSGSNYCAYEGVAWRASRDGTKEKFSISGRIIIDAFGWNRFNTNHHIMLKPLPRQSPEGSTWNDMTVYDGDIEDGAFPEDGIFGDEEENEKKRRPLTDEQKMMCSPLVRGYALKEKLWLNFYVNCVNHVEFDDKAFNSLVLPENQKELLYGLAATPQSQRSQFDDVITGKGRGLMFLLCGPPGVGKTLTAEAVAERMRVPLFIVAAGDLGNDSRSIETTLSRFLDMCTRWNAIFLLDEADIFLEQRRDSDFSRNGLVSIFLRVLEYYQGTMFLTTNRVHTIDDAFRSRIHVSLEYKDLDVASRIAVWKNFLERHNIAQAKSQANAALGYASAASIKVYSAQSLKRSLPTEDEIKATEEEHRLRTQPHQITDKEIHKLGSFKMNGREIKNMLKTAQMMASNNCQALSFSHIELVLGETQHLHNKSREDSFTKSSLFH